MELVELAGEVVALLACLAVAFPYALSLEHTFRLQLPSGVPNLQWHLWTWCFFLLSIYFNFHPKPVHNHHHHLITDIVKFPNVLMYALPLITLLVFTCRVYDLYLQTMPKDADWKRKLSTVGLWIVPAVAVTAVFAVGAWMLIQSPIRRSLVLYGLGGFGIVGSVLFAAACLSQFTRSTKDVEGASVLLHYLPFLVQMLGLMCLDVVLVLNYVNPDWLGVAQFGIMFVANLVYVLSRFVVKSRGYAPVTETETEIDEFEV